MEHCDSIFWRSWYSCSRLRVVVPLMMLKSWYCQLSFLNSCSTAFSSPSHASPNDFWKAASSRVSLPPARVFQMLRQSLSWKRPPKSSVTTCLNLEKSTFLRA